MNKQSPITKWIILVAIIAGGIFFFINKKSHDNAAKGNLPKNEIIVAFGDSLTEGIGASKTDGQRNGFPELLSSEIGIDIINKGKSGDTTQAGLDRIDDIIALDPGTVIVLFGGNDFLRQVPQEKTFSNLKKIIDEFQENNTRVILLGVRGGLLSDVYLERFDKLAEEEGVPYVPNVLDGPLRDNSLMSDTIHPNDKGYALIAAKVLPVLKKTLGM